MGRLAERVGKGIEVLVGWGLFSLMCDACFNDGFIMLGCVGLRVVVSWMRGLFAVFLRCLGGVVLLVWSVGCDGLCLLQVFVGGEWSIDVVVGVLGLLRCFVGCEIGVWCLVTVCHGSGVFEYCREVRFTLALGYNLVMSVWCGVGCVVRCWQCLINVVAGRVVFVSG